MRISELRKTYSISWETLAERSGVSIDLIRRIEEGHIPDLAPLIKISRGLGVRLGTLLDDHEELGPVVSRAGKTSEEFTTGIPQDSPSPDDAKGHKGLHFRSLAADKGSRHMEPFIVDIEADAEQKKSTHEGEEFIYVLSGQLIIEYGKDTYTLNTGDSIFYDSIIPHSVLAGGDLPARIVAVLYTPL
jgi:quercetin dioxygenase-like cupin family protein/DNA-binding XRE family transcriptional regulator